MKFIWVEHKLYLWQPDSFCQLNTRGVTFETITEKMFRSSRPEVFLAKGVLKICSKFTGEHPCRSVISIKLQSNGFLLYVCFILVEHLFLRTLMECWFCNDQYSPDKETSQLVYRANDLTNINMNGKLVDVNTKVQRNANYLP